MATNFLDQTQLTNAINSATSVPSPTAPEGGQGIVIVNNTQFPLMFADQFFDSGELAIAPSPIPPFSSGSFTVTPKDISFAGVTGAATFTFEPLPNVQCRLGVGFGNPAIGGYDSNVAFDADQNQPGNSNPVLNPIGLFTQGTYNNNSTSPSQDSSAQFTGTDSNGYPTTIQIVGRATPASVANITITQVIVAGGA